MPDSNASSSSTSSDSSEESTAVFKRSRQREQPQLSAHPKPSMNIPPSIERLTSSPSSSDAPWSPFATGLKRKASAGLDNKKIKKLNLDGRAEQSTHSQQQQSRGPIATKESTSRSEPKEAGDDVVSSSKKKDVKSVTAPKSNVKHLQTQPVMKADDGLTAVEAARVRKERRKKNKQRRDGEKEEEDMSTLVDYEVPQTREKQIVQEVQKIHRDSASVEPAIAEGKPSDSEQMFDISPAIVALLRERLDASSRIQTLEQEIAGLKAAIKEVVKHGGMLTAENHGQLGSALQMLKTKLKGDK